MVPWNTKLQEFFPNGNISRSRRSPPFDLTTVEPNARPCSEIALTPANAWPTRSPSAASRPTSSSPSRAVDSPRSHRRRPTGRPLDVVVAKKIGAPHNPELAIGAVAENGALWLNQSLIDNVGVHEQYVEDERAAVSEAASESATVSAGTVTRPVGQTRRRGRRRRRGWGGDDAGLPPARSRRKTGERGGRGASRPRDSIEELREFADEVVALETPWGPSARSGPTSRISTR